MIGLIVPNAFAEGVPTWVKNTAGWWATDMISENEFVNAIQFLISNGIMVVSHADIDNEIKSQKVPEWVKNNAGWWADGQIPDSTFIDGIEYLIESGIIQIKGELDESQIILQKRGELIDFIWKGEGLPTRLPDSIEYGITDKNFSELKNLEKIDRIKIEMKHGVNSIAYLMHPSEQLHDDLIIYHAGHGQYLYHGEKQIRFFLDRGYAVLVFSMPVTGYNNEPTVIIEGKERKITNHNSFKLLDSEKFSVISYFVEPITVSLNYLDEEYDYTNYHMIGISGGGWTTVIYPAIDQRISYSYSVAGSIPLEQRTDKRDLGDYESSLPELYQITNYIDLYTLASVGEDRKFTQVFLQDDQCCYAANRLDFSYQEEVKNNIKNFGSGEFEIGIMKGYKHNVSASALNYVFVNIDEENSAYFFNSEERLANLDFSSSMFNDETLWNQNLDKTAFVGGDFSGSFISNGDLSNYDLNGTNFWYSALHNNNFTNTDLSNSDLSYSIICNSKIENTIIHNVDFSFSLIYNMDFSKGSLKNTKFDSSGCYYCNFEGIDITEIKITKDLPANTNFAGSSFRNVDFRDWEFGIIDFSAKIVYGCIGQEYTNVPPADLTGANFSGLDLKDITFARNNNPAIAWNDVNFSFADLSFHDLRNMSLKNANFSNADLTGVDFTNAHPPEFYRNSIGVVPYSNIIENFPSLENANFSNANLTGVDFTNVYLENANFSGAILDDAILNCYNHEICN